MVVGSLGVGRDEALAPSDLPPPILKCRSATDGNAACAGELKGF